jgi:hypothetical protein
MVASADQSLSVALPLLAAGAHRGGNAVFWIVGWVAILAALIGGAVRLVRRRGRTREHGGS